MRILLVLTAFALLAPVASSADAEPRGSISVSVLRLDPGETLVAWSPAPGAIGYQVRRGDSVDSAVPIAQTTLPSFLDTSSRSTGEIWYVIESIHTSGSVSDILGRYRGACVTSSSTGVAITASHCMPVRPL